MAERLSPRLRAAVDALPLDPDMRVVEIGCGPGPAALEIARRVGPGGHVLAVDRSAKAIAAVEEKAANLIDAGLFTALCSSAEALVLPVGHDRYDLCLATRVGAFDGRHPEAGQAALPRVVAVLRPEGRMFIDGGDPLREVDLTARPAPRSALR